MARRPSKILTAEDRKQARSVLKDTIASHKADQKELSRRLTTLGKERMAVSKKISRVLEKIEKLEDKFAQATDKEEKAGFRKALTAAKADRKALEKQLQEQNRTEKSVIKEYTALETRLEDATAQHAALK